MRIGIIGAGSIGGTLTRRFRQVGHDVFVANAHGPASLAELAAQTGAKAVTVEEAARAGDVVVVTIPEHDIPKLARDLFAQTPASVAVVDTGNYYPRQRDGRIEAIEAGLPESCWVQEQLNHRVTKAFNTMYAEHLLTLGKPPGTPGRLALPVAGDDVAAKAPVMQLVDEIGFDPVDAGNLNESWRQQPGSPVYTQDFDAAQVRAALAQATPERAEYWRATAKSPGTFEAPV